ncbi:GFA family protein [Sphingomonas sp. ASV193]|uniref:GFA family protein n=1 Tax=Sphingomonas sp. ASV193 TaxID=3144405 RepID=UPI0032E882AB
MTSMTGGCACGRVRFEAEVDSDEAYLCHCRMCQRASGSVSLAMIGIARDAVRWGREPDWYASSPIARRPFCASCGTSLGFAFNDSDQMDLTVAAFDEPARFRPIANYCSDSINRAFLDASRLPEKPVGEIDSVTSRWASAGLPTP